MCRAVSTMFASNTWKFIFGVVDGFSELCRRARAKVVKMCRGSFVPTRREENGVDSVGSRRASGASSSTLPACSRHRLTTCLTSSAGETPQKLCTWCGSSDIAHAKREVRVNERECVHGDLLAA